MRCMAPFVMVRRREVGGDEMAMAYGEIRVTDGERTLGTGSDDDFKD